jgi:hypothetical protein
MIGEPNKLGFYPDKIDPQTGGYSVLRRHLTTIKKDLTSRYGVQGLINPGNPWKLFLGLGLEQNRNGFPVPRKKLKPINKKIANQAISSGVAERLLDLKAQGEPVLVAELVQILDDHYSRFNTTILIDNQNAKYFEQDEAGNFLISADEAQIKKEFLAKKQAQFLKEEIEKSEVLPEGYDPGAANAPRDPLPNGEDRFLNEFDDVVGPKVAERLEKAEALFPAMVPFLAPKDPAYNAWENMDQTVHIDTQLQKYSDNNFSKERIGDKWGGYYLEPASSEIGPGSFLEMWAAFHPRLDAASENAYGLDLDLRKDHALEYDRSGPNHSLVPGTYGWTRGLLMSHEPGALGYGFWEMQQDIYRQGDPKGPRPEWRKLRFRSEVAETELTPGEKTLQRKLDGIDNAIEAYVSKTTTGRSAGILGKPLALITPFMPLEKDTGRTGEFSSTQDYPISPQQFPRYVIKGGIPSRDNGQLRSLFPRIGDDPESRTGGAAAAFFDPLPEQGRSLASEGHPIPAYELSSMIERLRLGELTNIDETGPARYPLGEKIALDADAAQKELTLKAQGKAEDVFYDWLLEAQPFRSLGRTLSSRDAKNILIDSEIRGDIQYWKPSFGSFFNQVELADSEVEATIEGINKIMPFVKYVAWQQMAPTVLKKARPFATVAIQNHPELAPVLDLYLNPDKNFTQENISRLEEKELTGRIEEKDKIPDYPHKGTQYGKEADWAKDLLHRGIVKLLQTFPDITHVYLHKYGTEGSPVYPYVEVIKEAKKMAKELGLDMKKIGEYPTKAALGKKEGGRTVLTDVTNEVWYVNIEKMREIVLMGGVEGMRKGGVVKKAVNHTMNYGNYGRKFL